MVYNMKLKILIVFIFLLPKIAKSDKFVSIKETHVPLIIDICKLYRIKSIIFLYAEAIKEMEMTTMVFQWTRVLSREEFMTTNFYFSQMHYSSYYVKKIVQPLYVALISNYDAINEFSLATRNFDMSFAIWLVLFIYKGNGSDYCHNPLGNIFHLRFDSQMLVLCDTENILSEWYSLGTNQTEIKYLATWNSEKGIVQTVSNSLYERRNNLQGTIMKTVNVKKNPSVVKNKDNNNNNNNNNNTNDSISQLFIELSKILNFTIKVVSEVDDYGIHDAKKDNWSGAIWEVFSGHCDVAISDFAMTSKRLNVVDFSYPIYIANDCLYFKKSHNFTINWSTYFLTFNHSVWIAVFLTLLLSAILITYIKIKIKTEINLLHLISDSFLEIWGIFCNQGLPDFPKKSSLKIAYFSVFLFITVIAAAYSASLISTLTSAIQTLPFSSIDDFAKDGTYKLSVFRGSADYDLFTNSDSPPLKELMKLMIDNDKLPLNFVDAFKMICDDPKLVLHAYVLIKDDFTFDIPCDIVSIKTGSVKSLSIVFSKHNQFKGVINFHLQKFINNGMLNRLKDTTYIKKFQQPIQEHVPVSIVCVISLFFFILIGVVLSICILFVEKYAYAHKMKNDLVVDLIPSSKTPRHCVKRQTIFKNIANNLTN